MSHGVITIHIYDCDKHNIILEINELKREMEIQPTIWHEGFETDKKLNKNNVFRMYGCSCRPNRRADLLACPAVYFIRATHSTGHFYTLVFHFSTKFKLEIFGQRRQYSAKDALEKRKC